MPSLSPPSLQDADTLNVQDASAAMGNGRCGAVTDVSAVRQDRIADEDLDAGVDYFQAQGRIAAQAMEGRGA